MIKTNYKTHFTNNTDNDNDNNHNKNISNTSDDNYNNNVMILRMIIHIMTA